MTSKYETLLCTKRGRPTETPGRDLVLESESDRSRIVFSPPFRRLQQKAQVFSLEANAAVRSRLTHSLEVAQIGRFLADQIIARLQVKNELNDVQGRAFTTFVEVACLMHDLGNPPFGHFGEAAIAEWFRERGESHARKAMCMEPRKDGQPLETEYKALLADFLEFDGNCQGLRIASLLQWKDDEHGLNLTYTSLASYLKYIRSPLFDSKEKSKLSFQKKAGFFDTERPLVEAIWGHFNYDKNSPQRFPLTYVMEAADDIAYCISDLEDSIEKGLLKPKHIFPEISKDWEARLAAHPKLAGSDATAITKMLAKAASSESGNGSTFTNFRTNLSRLLTDIASKNYCDNHDDVLSGTSPGLIDEDSPGGHILEMLKTFCRKNVYEHATVQRTELVGLSAIRGLLDHFGILLQCSQERFNAALNNKNGDDENRPIVYEKKLLSLFPEKHITAYKHACQAHEIYPQTNDLPQKFTEWNLRAHLITDFISGMTDDFALASFQMLSGIKVD